MVKTIKLHKDYTLPEENFNTLETDKTKILIADSYNLNMNHYKKWLIFNGGKYKNTAHYTIIKDGTIHEHIKPEYSTNFIKGGENYVIILIENIGWLKKENNLFKAWDDTIYKGEVFEFNWRNNKFWDPYTDKQINSTIELLTHLVNKFNLEPSISTNSFLNSVSGETIVYRSNMHAIYRDINPSWDFKMLKKKIYEKK